MRFDLARMLSAIRDSAIRDGSIFPSFALDGKINPSPFTPLTPGAGEGKRPEPFKDGVPIPPEFRRDI